MSQKRPALAIGAAVTFVVAGAALVYAATLFVRGYGDGALDARARAVEEAPDVVVEDYRAEQQGVLDEAAWIDREAGTVKLPIERAMELVVEENDEGGAR